MTTNKMYWIRHQATNSQLQAFLDKEEELREKCEDLETQLIMVTEELQKWSKECPHCKKYQTLLESLPETTHIYYSRFSAAEKFCLCHGEPNRNYGKERHLNNMWNEWKYFHDESLSPSR